MSKVKLIFTTATICAITVILALHYLEFNQKKKMTELIAEDNLVAVIFYKDKNGTLPATLSEATKYGANEFDAWGQRFKYKKCDEFYFTIYSMGSNGLDDQGDKDDVSASKKKTAICPEK